MPYPYSNKDNYGNLGHKAKTILAANFELTENVSKCNVSYYST